MSKATEILDERFARGEIDVEEYNRLKSVLAESAAPTDVAGNKTQVADARSQEVAAEPPRDAGTPLPIAANASGASWTDSPWVKVVGVFVVVAVLMGINRSRERGDGVEVCNENRMFQSAAGCACFADEFVSRVPNSYFLPIVGGLFFEPSASEGAQIAQNALNVCKGRHR